MRSGKGAAPGETKRGRTVGLWLLGTIAALLVGLALSRTTQVTMPLALGFFVALAVWPICARMRERLPRRMKWLGYVAAMAVLVACFAVFFAGVWFAAQQVASEWSQYQQQFESWWNSISRFASNTGAGGGGGGSQGAGDGGQANGGALGFVGGYAETILRSTGAILITLVLVFFFVLLMLIEAPVWRDKLAHAVADHHDREWVAGIDQVGRRFRWYLAVRTVLGVITALLYGAWLWLWGIPFLAVWMLLAFLLNYIPTIGSLIAGVLPVIFAFLQKDIGSAIAVGAGILLIEQVMGNYVDPRVQGRQLSISPVVVLFMLLVWGWIWGVVGALLAVPMTVLMIMIFTVIPPLRHIGLFLSGERNMRDLERKILWD